MVVLPKNFVMTKYPGYFWNVVKQELYSLKSGELSPIKYCKGGWFNGHNVYPGYPVSVNGVRRKLSLEYLENLEFVDVHQVISIKTVYNN